jgi:diguanylate cyclase (GGDEF)-like protein
MRTEKKSTHIFSFLNESEQLLHKKFKDHRLFSALMFAMAASIGMTHWVWDYVTDPVGAQNTVYLRSFFSILLIFSYAFIHIKSRRILEVSSLAVCLLLLFNYVEILNRINTGMIYGIGGFVFFLFLPLLMFQGFSIRVSIVATLLIAVFPQVLGFLDIAHHFEQMQYAVLIWPAAGSMIIVHYAFAQNYRLRYDSETALEFASNTDPLTGVSNRRYFVPAIRHELIRSQRFNNDVSLIILDIDDFKKINDVHGHSTGDTAICALANICRRTARQIDIVARLGGDEFAILLLEVSLEDALIVAERIRLAVQNTPVKSFEGAEVKFTVSIGVAEQPTNNMSEEWLIELADAAMYDAKSAGRNCVVASNRQILQTEMMEI